MNTDMLETGEGFQRILTIVARGYLWQGRDADLDHARRALCAWSSISDTEKAGPKAGWENKTGYAELHGEFPELVGEEGWGWLIRHVHSVCTVPEITVRDSRITNILAFGEYKASCWEAALSELFHDPKGFELQYTLSNDYGGAVRLEDGFLRADLEEDQDRSFTLTAENEIGQRAKIAFDLTVPTVSAKLSQVTNMLNLGSLHDFQWELPLDGLFYDSAQTALTYALSDDHNGAVTIENDALHVDLHELREVDFDLTASNVLGRQAVISFAAAVPGPVAAVDEIAEQVKTGLFQKGMWERDLKNLFRDPKGTALRHTLSDDMNGAASIENGVLRVNMKGLKKAVFTVIATDEYGLSAEIPVTLTGKNMTILYSLLALIPVSIPAAVVGYRRRH